MTLALGKLSSGAVLAAFVVFSQGAALAQSVPAAIFTDPPPDKAHPAKMTVVHIPTHGLLINGVVYQASGDGLHPTIVICHGLPGEESRSRPGDAARGLERGNVQLPGLVGQSWQLPLCSKPRRRSSGP